MASAQCQIIDGKLTADCTPASADNSGMFVGADGTQLTDVNTANLTGFQWVVDGTILKPTDGASSNLADYTDLNFSLTTGTTITGSATGSGTKAYTITIGTDTNKVFLLNAGDKTLSGNLKISFNGTQQFFYLNAGGLENNLEVANAGNFIANLTGGIKGSITNNTSTITLNFTSPTNAKVSDPITLAGTITNNGTLNLNFSNAVAEITNSFTTASGTNNITLDSSAKEGNKTSLTLNGATNAITAFTALGGANTLTIGAGATTKNEISTLNLGKDKDTATGSLTITNNSAKALTITDFNSQDAGNVLTIAKGNVEITNAVTENSKANFTLDSSAGATGLTLKDTASAGNTITKLTALSGDSQEMNTLTIAKEANKTNTITELVLGNENVKGLLTIANSGSALGITTLTANAEGSKLVLNGAYGEIEKLTFTSKATLDLDASGVTGSNLTITNFESNSADGTLIISKGNVGINTLTGTNNNIALSGTDNSTNKASLTLKGTADNAINTFTALGGTTVGDNTLTIDAAANGTNTIENLVLGAAAVSGSTQTPAKAGFLTIDNQAKIGANPVALTITNLTANGNDSALTLKGAYGAIGTLTLGNEATLTLDASGVVDSTGSQPLVVNTFTGGTGSTLAISAGKVNIGNLAEGENNIALSNKTSLTLNGGTLKSLTTADTHTITFASGNTTINAIAGSGTNAFTLTGTTGEGTKATIKGAISGTNNFTLDSTAGATTLTLGGAGNKTLTSLTALGESADAITNTLTIENGADQSSIGTLNLGESGSTTTGFLTINNSSGKVLEITNFASQEAGNILTIDKGAVGITSALAGNKNNIALSNATLTLTGGGDLNKLETAGTTNTINLDGDTSVTEKISAGNDVTNNFHIGKTKQAKLTLTGGFSTTGGKNSFTIYEKGALDLGTALDNGLTTEMGTTEFIIKEGARFELLKDIAIIAKTGGTNIITSNANITLGDITANGENTPSEKTTKNEITINKGELTLGQITSTNSGENYFIIGNENGSPNTAILVLGSTGVTTESKGKTSFTINSGSTLKLTNTADLTLSANDAINEFDIKDGVIIDTTTSGDKFYENITATNSGKNIIKTSASFNLNTLTANTGGTNNITLRGKAGTATAMEVTGAITANGTGKNNFTLDSTADTTAKTSLTLQGATGNAINDFTALGGTDANDNKLTIVNTASGENKITNLVLGGSVEGEDKAGLLTIDNQTTSSVLTIGTFKGEVADSKLTISAGKVAITGELKGDHNNIALGDGSELTLNGGNLNSLSTAEGTTGAHTINFASNTTTVIGTSGITAEASVTNTIILNNGVTLTSAITANGGTNNITLANNSNITGSITATSGTNSITLTGTNSTTSATINGEISGVGNRITLDSKATAGDKTNLTLSGENDKTIANLTALSADAQAMNTLTIGANAEGENKIETLNLGENPNKQGFLTITNNSGNALKIGTFTNAGDKGNTLIINKGAVEITGDVGGATPKLANFTLDSQAADKKTPSLTLGGASDNTITKLTALSVDNTAMNTLTIAEGAKGANAITELVLGNDTKSGLLTIDNQAKNSGQAVALNITNITANGKDSALTLKGAYGAIETLALAQDSTLKLNTVEVGDNRKLTINTLTSGQDSQLKIDMASNVIITNALSNANIALNGQEAALTLNNVSGKSTIAKLDTTGTGNTINFNAGETTISAITGDGTNTFKLTGTQNATSAIFNGAISGENNFTLDSSASQAKTQLTLKGADGNTITSLTALGGTQAEDNKLTIDATANGTNSIESLVLGDSGSKKEGLLTIENGAIKDGNKVALTIDKFEGKYTDSTLTISKGEVVINELAGTGENNNITLDSTNSATALTLINGGTLNKLETKGTKGNTITFNSGTTTVIGTNGITAGAAGVTNNINLSGGAILDSAITANGGTNNITLANNSSIKKDITATDGSNIINLTGASATIAGNLKTAPSGSNSINFASADSTMLKLKGVRNEVTTLTLGGKNNVIDLAGTRNDNHEIGARSNFKLLEIGKNGGGNNAGIGLNGNKDTTLTFESYVNPFTGADVTLGGAPISDDGSNPYGYAYSDRVIIHNAGNNANQAEGNYKFNAYYSSGIDNKKLEEIKYTQGTGTDKMGNIALFTIAKDGNKGVINLATSGNNGQAQSTTRSGFDAITTTLTPVATNQYGKIEQGNNNYLTYFINKVEVAGSNTGNGNGNTETDNPLVNSIIRDSNLMIQSMAVSAVNLYLANFNSLNKRMGELRDNAYSKGVWARTFIGSQSNELGLSDQMGYFSIQAGFDGALKREKANNFIGFAISYSKNFGYSSTKNNARSLNSGVRAPELGIDSLNSQLLELALYNSYVADSGWYNDTIGKFSYIQNSMSVKDQIKGDNGINGASGKFNTFALTLSNEVGYRAKLGEDKAWFIDPQAELAIGHINGVNFSLNHYRINQATASISSAINLRARAGASIGYDFKNFTQDKGIDAKVYVGAFYEMDYFHYTDGSKGIKYTTKLKDLREVKMLDTDHRAVLNVGTNLTIKDATRIYLDFEKSFGGKITTDYKINAGVRYSFGENANYKSSNAVQKDNEVKEVPLKLQENEEEE